MSKFGNDSPAKSLILNNTNILQFLIDIFDGTLFANKTLGIFGKRLKSRNTPCMIFLTSPYPFIPDIFILGGEIVC